MLSKSDKIDLYKFCMDWPKSLSTEFIMSYCEFKSITSLYKFMQTNGLRRRQKKNSSLPDFQNKITW